MNFYEWDGEAYIQRRSDGTEGSATPTQWDDELRPEDWRRILLECFEASDPAAGDEAHEKLLADEARSHSVI